MSRKAELMHLSLLLLAAASCGESTHPSQDSGADAAPAGIFIGLHGNHADVRAWSIPKMIADGQGGVVIVHSQDWRREKQAHYTEDVLTDAKEYAKRLGAIAPQVVLHHVRRDGARPFGEGLDLADPSEGGLSPVLGGRPRGPWVVGWKNKFWPGKVLMDEVPGRSAHMRVVKADGRLGPLHRDVSKSGYCTLTANPGPQLFAVCLGEQVWRLDENGGVVWKRPAPPAMRYPRADGQRGLLWATSGDPADIANYSCPLLIHHVADADTSIESTTTAYGASWGIECRARSKASTVRDNVLAQVAWYQTSSDATGLQLLVHDSHGKPLREPQVLPGIEFDATLFSDRAGALWILGETPGFHPVFSYSEDATTSISTSWASSDHAYESYLGHADYVQAYRYGLITATSSEKLAPFEPEELRYRARVMAFDTGLRPRWKAPTLIGGRGFEVYATAPDNEGGIWVLGREHGPSASGCKQRASDGWWSCGDKLYLQHVDAQGRRRFP